MCGIFGVFSSRGLGGYANGVQEAHRRGLHRGPDDLGFVAFRPSGQRGYGIESISRNPPAEDVLRHSTVLLAHHRLSIIDLSSAGHQPMPDRSEKYWIVFNGEIYNYLELRDELRSAGHHFRA